MKNRILKISLIAALLCFLLPYVMVSCNGEDVTYSGVELATGHSFDDSVLDDDDYAPNAFVLIAFIIGVVALIIAFARKEDDGSVAVCSAMAVIALILFKVTFISYYDLERYKDYIEVRWGFYATIICYITSIVTALIPEKTSSWHDLNFSTDTGTNTQPQANADKFCKQCGAELTPNAAFCFLCGATQEPSDTCANCGYKFVNSDSFCPECGTKRER